MARLTSNGIQFNLLDPAQSINSFYWMYPSGTTKLFYQSTAPTGWTKLINKSSGGNNLSLNNVALRVVGGTGGGFGVGNNANSNTGGLFTTILSNPNPSSGNFSLNYNGTFSIDVVPGNASIVGNTTLSLTQLPDHTHPSLFGPTSGANATPFSNTGARLTSGTLETGTMQQSTGGGSHNHPFSGSVIFTNYLSVNTINMDVQYVDVIVCSLN